MIDYEGETIDDARTEVDSWFRGAPLPEHSFVAIDADGRLVSASLISRYEEVPLVAYTFTHAEAKGRGLATALLRASLASLCSAGERVVALGVTVGNTPAEGIYERLGFREAS
jgi:predicted GNAT family acetyltransferase